MKKILIPVLFLFLLLFFLAMPLKIYATPGFNPNPSTTPLKECVALTHVGAPCSSGYTKCPQDQSINSSSMYCCLDTANCENVVTNYVQEIVDSAAPPPTICNFAGSQKAACESCLSSGGVLTALGCIKTSPKAFIGDFLKIAIGIAGGIALLLMVYGAFLISVSAGDPKKAEEGKEMITGTIAGLLFIIFSVFLLKLIGVSILQIPGF